MSALLALVLTAAVAGGAFWLYRTARETERRRDFARRVEARKRGWRYDGRRDGRIDYRFAGGAHGITWQMWHDSDRGDDSPVPKSIWTTSNLRTAELSLVVLGRRRFDLESGVVGRMLMGAVSGVAHAITGEASRADKAEFYEGAVEIDGDLPGFRERFSVAVAPDMPRKWFDVELQQLLMRWPEIPGARSFSAENQLEITLRADGLRIVAQRMPEDMAFWFHLAQLGERLARQLAAASGATSPPVDEVARRPVGHTA